MPASPRFSPPPTFDVLGVDVAAVDKAGFLDALDRWHGDDEARARGAYVCFRDVNGVVLSWESPELAAAHAGALINAPDGKPLVWIGRRRGLRMEQVCGPDMLPAVCQFGVSRGWRHVLYGSTPAVLEALTARLAALAPGVQIVDAISPPFSAPSETERQADLARIRGHRPHFVWVGLGTPKQELWMAQNARHLPGALCMGVGAAFPMHAGRIRRSPAWMRRTGLEWLGRAVAEPRRLGRRYAVVVPRFLGRLALQAVAARAGAGRPGSPPPPDGPQSKASKLPGQP